MSTFVAAAISLFNSNFFVALVTAVTAAVAWFVYNEQKSDRKQQAARLLLMEIRSAEVSLDEVRSKIHEQTRIGVEVDFPKVFPSSSWQEYCSLFAGDLDQDELHAISAFYNCGALIDELTFQFSDFFWITMKEKAKVIQHKLADIALDSTTTPEQKDGLKRVLMEDYVNDQRRYSPNKTVLSIAELLEKTPAITTTSTALKLKKIARANS
jgi:cbb3-type cytochrome oxidase subunit 3